MVGNMRTLKGIALMMGLETRPGAIRGRTPDSETSRHHVTTLRIQGLGSREHDSLCSAETKTETR
jgi:hypothetical protein